MNNQEFMARVKNLLRREEINDRLEAIINDVKVCMVDSPQQAIDLWAAYQEEIAALKAEMIMLRGEY